MSVNDREEFLAEAQGTLLHPWLQKELSATPSDFSCHGDLPRWQTALQAISKYQTRDIDLAAGTIRIGKQNQLSPLAVTELERNLRQLHPWRTGPFEVFGIGIDTEWRSDWKWQRLAEHIAPLKNRRILDIGCGNGYYMLRMLGAGARWVLGMDPTPLFSLQYAALVQMIRQPLAARIVALGVDTLPDHSEYFDTAFSMGVIYHRRSPLDHLRKLFDSLRDGGELVLETLVVDGPTGMSLMPEGRYAKMRNVWFIPSTGTLELWLRRTGFQDVRTVDVTTTTPEEQRATDWMHFESLEDFLDPADRSKTIEGYPAPVRAILLATKS
jgi:tRNA (mo5U34)-methyltransferase